MISDELDYFVNTYILNFCGMGFTACEPSLVELENGQQAIRFKLDFTFVEESSHQIKGYGQLESEIGFVGEIFISYDEINQSQMEILYVTPLNGIELQLQAIFSHPEQFPPSDRLTNKY